MPVAKGQLNKRLLVGIILDRSSSMSLIQAETISGTNEQFSVLRDSDDAANTFVAFFSFNEQVTPVFKNDDGTPKLVPCKDLKDITDGDYIPSGMTAMYDGVGDAIDFFAVEAKKADDVLLVIISDGLENASKRFTQDQISSRVKELQDAGWNFTYIGANQDLTQVQVNLGFHAGNMLSFNADVSGTQAMNSTLGGALRSYTSTRSAHIASGNTTRLSTSCLYSQDKNENVADDGHVVGDTVEMTTSGKQSSTITITTAADEGVTEKSDDVA